MPRISLGLVALLALTGCETLGETYQSVQGQVARDGATGQQGGEAQATTIAAPSPSLTCPG